MASVVALRPFVRSFGVTTREYEKRSDENRDRKTGRPVRIEILARENYLKDFRHVVAILFVIISIVYFCEGASRARARAVEVFGRHGK